MRAFKEASSGTRFSEEDRSSQAGCSLAFLSGNGSIWDSTAGGTAPQFPAISTGGNSGFVLFWDDTANRVFSIRLCFFWGGSLSGNLGSCF